MKFEYATLDFEKIAPPRERVDRQRDVFLKALQAKGEEGWELVNVAGPLAFLKRSIPNGEPTALAKVCANCTQFERSIEKDADGASGGKCAEWSLFVASEGACERFCEKAYGQPEGQANPIHQVEGRPTGQSAGEVVAGPSDRDGVRLPPDADSAWHWQPRTEFGEKRLEATTSQDQGIDSPDHKHKVVVILDKNGKVVRGKTDVVNGHDHPVTINGLVDDADGHTHTYDPTPRG